jgi:hypothetical protein
LMRAACTLAHSFRAIEGASRREPFNAVIAVATTVYVCFAALQWCTMRDQLRQMQSSSTQTDNMIAALQNQAASLSGQLASMKAFQRAFLSIETILDSTYDSGAVPKHYMRFVYVNSGNTPTRNLSIEIACIPKESINPVPFDFSDPALSSRGEMLVPPHGRVVQGGCPIAEDQMAAYAHGASNLFLVARATYGDVSDPHPHHRTEYCAIFHGLVANPLVQGASAPSVRYVPNVNLQICNQHNCADEECERQDNEAAQLHGAPSSAPAPKTPP